MDKACYQHISLASGYVYTALCNCRSRCELYLLQNEPQLTTSIQFDTNDLLTERTGLLVPSESFEVSGSAARWEERGVDLLRESGRDQSSMIIELVSSGEFSNSVEPH